MEQRTAMTPLSGLALLGFLMLAFGGAASLLDAPTDVEASCGETLTLNCNTSTAVAEIKLFTWSAKDKLVCDKEKKTKECEMSSSGGLQNLALTLDNITTSHFGQYLCKIHTSSGTASQLVKLMIRDCPIKKSAYMNATFAVCQFKDVRNLSKVHWFVNGEDVTLSSGQNTTQHPSGFFDIEGHIILTKMRHPHQCKLWDLQAKQYVKGQVMNVSSGAGRLSAHWAWLLLSLVLLRL